MCDVWSDILMFSQLRLNDFPRIETLEGGKKKIQVSAGFIDSNYDEIHKLPEVKINKLNDANYFFRYVV